MLVKSIAEERSKSSQRLQELHREEDRMDAERTRLEREKAKIDAEKDRLSDLAIQVKQKSAEVDSMSEVSSSDVLDRVQWALSGSWKLIYLNAIRKCVPYLKLHVIVHVLGLNSFRKTNNN